MTEPSRIVRSAYPMGSVARRALLTLRHEGVSSFWFKLLARCGYRRLLLLEQSLDSPIPDCTPGLAIDIAMLGEEAIDEYLAFRTDTERGEAVERLRSGQLCVVARREGRIVAGVWVALQPLWNAFLDCEIDMGPGDVYAYDKFVLPACRGYEISRALRAYHLKRLQAAGYRRAIVAVMPENASSLRDIVKGGYRPYAMLGRIKIGPWKRVFISRPSRRDAPDSAAVIVQKA